MLCPGVYRHPGKDALRQGHRRQTKPAHANVEKGREAEHVSLAPSVAAAGTSALLCILFAIFLVVKPGGNPVCIGALEYASSRVQVFFRFCWGDSTLLLTIQKYVRAHDRSLKRGG